jgi:uncharacterized protein with PIN domain
MKKQELRELSQLKEQAINALTFEEKMEINEIQKALYLTYKTKQYKIDKIIWKGKFLEEKEILTDAIELRRLKNRQNFLKTLYGISKCEECNSEKIYIIKECSGRRMLPPYFYSYCLSCNTKKLLEGIKNE